MTLLAPIAPTKMLHPRFSAWIWLDLHFGHLTASSPIIVSFRYQFRSRHIMSGRPAEGLPGAKFARRLDSRSWQHQSQPRHRCRLVSFLPDA